MSVKLRTVSAFLSALGLVALAGCGGDNAADAKARKAAQNPAATPGLPDEAKKQTPEGEVAFTKHYFRAINDAFATGKTDALVHMSAPTCEICRATIGDINYAYARGQIRGGELRVQKIGPAEDVGAFSNRLVTYSEAKYEEVDGDGAVLYAAPAKSDYRMMIKLTWTGTGWQVAQLKRHGTASG